MANLLILVKFGYEILQHGWIHGITTIGKELVHLHVTGTDPLMLWHGASSPEGASYTSATISIVRNVDIIRRNINVLSEDERDNIGKVIAPIIGFLALIIGQGWLWGKASIHETIHSTDKTTKSTVEIEELTDDGSKSGPDNESQEPGDACVGTENQEQCSSDNKLKQNVLQPRKEQSQNLDSEMLARTSKHACDTIKSDSTNESADKNHIQSMKQVDIEVIDSKVSTGSTSDRCPLVNTSQSEPDSSTHINAKEDPKRKYLSIVSVDDIAELMEMLSQCDEYGLLDTSARNAILVKLAKFQQDGNHSFGEWYRSIHSNLRNLLDSREIMRANLRSLLASAEVPESSESFMIVKSDPEKSTIASSLDDINKTTSESLPNDRVDLLELDCEGGHGALSVGTEEDQDKLEKAKTSSDIIELNAVKSSLKCHASVDEDDDDDEFLPLENASTASQPLDCDPTSCKSEKCMESEEENVWLKIGSGIAILGGIVGGVVMMNSVHNKRHDQEKKR
jgi:hypothetical protein